jgi:hypothetical protein
VPLVVFVRVNRGFGASLGACLCVMSDRWLPALAGGCGVRAGSEASGFVRRRGVWFGRGGAGIPECVIVCVGVFAWMGCVVPAAGCRWRGLLLCMAEARAKQGHSVDALAPGGDEGRGTLRKATGSREQALIRGCPNGATHPFGVASSESIGWCGEPGELKHLSTRRNRHQHWVSIGLVRWGP